MTVGLATGSIVAAPGQSIGLSSLFTVTPGTTNPAYLVVSGLDRNEYTAGATGSTGTFSGNGAATGFSSIGGDSLGAGIVFTYNATTGQYVNATYGNLASVVLTASHDKNRNEAISLFASDSAANLTQYANNPYDLAQLTTYVGTVSVVTQPSGSAPSQATPNSIASTAMSFVGQAWNTDGCWVLASNISAEAGASLPLTSTSVDIPGTANGEWIVAYNGPAGQGGDWQSMVKAGEMVSFATSSTSGHITTVVSGSGANAMLVDNITYVNSNGTYANTANDGSANDVLVSAPHAASQEFSQAVAGSVVIYELDTPIVAAAGPAAVAFGGTLALSSLVSASDPGTRSITQYQIYDTDTQGGADKFLVNGVARAASSAGSAITESASAFASTALQAATSVGVNTLEVRAFNGTYWGDWQALTVDTTATGTASVVSIANQTASQTWRQGAAVSFTVATNTFTDSQNLALTYTATQSNGAALPSWLAFNAATDTFTGTVPTGTSALSLNVTATDSNGVSATETFAVATPGAPVVTAQTANQVWRAHQAVALQLAANTFTDPQGLGMTYTETQIGGPTASWLKFNGTTDTFSGTPKKTMKGTITLEVVATDSAGLSASETFSATMAPTAAKFAQAISALPATGGVGAVASAAPPANTLHALASPVA